MSTSGGGFKGNYGTGAALSNALAASVYAVPFAQGQGIAAQGQGLGSTNNHSSHQHRRLYALEETDTDGRAGEIMYPLWSSPPVDEPLFPSTPDKYTHTMSWHYRKRYTSSVVAPPGLGGSFSTDASGDVENEEEDEEEDEQSAYTASVHRALGVGRGVGKGLEVGVPRQQQQQRQRELAVSSPAVTNPIVCIAQVHPVDALHHVDTP